MGNRVREGEGLCTASAFVACDSITIPKSPEEQWTQMGRVRRQNSKLFEPEWINVPVCVCGSVSRRCACERSFGGIRKLYKLYSKHSSLEPQIQWSNPLFYNILQFLVPAVCWQMLPLIPMTPTDDKGRCWCHDGACCLAPWAAASPVGAPAARAWTMAPRTMHPLDSIWVD